MHFAFSEELMEKIFWAQTIQSDLSLTLLNACRVQIAYWHKTKIYTHKCKEDKL